MLTATNVVTAAQLGPPAGLGPPVDLHSAIREQSLDRPAGFDQTGQFEQLPEPDSCLADLYFLHIPVLAIAHGRLNHRGRRGARASSRTGL